MKLGMLPLRAGGTEVTTGQMEAGKPVLARSLPMSFIKSNKAVFSGSQPLIQRIFMGPLLCVKLCARFWKFPREHHHGHFSPGGRHTSCNGV